MKKKKTTEELHILKDEVLGALYKMVGLRKVKEEITWMTEYIEFVGMRRQNGFNDTLSPLNMFFSGHPGTGKNTIAGIIGRLFCSLGVLSNGKVTHCLRRDLVQDGYAVEEQLVRKAIEDSKGGILFIDDAGDLFDPQTPNDRGVIALNILVGILASEQPEVIVILADDDEEIDNILAAFPDLKQLFPRRLCFADYTPDELMEITRNKLTEREYQFDTTAEDKFIRLLKQVCATRDPYFGNGTFIDEKIDEAAQQMARRLMANNKGGYGREEMMTITAQDIMIAEESAPGKSLGKLEAMVGAVQLKQNIMQHMNYVFFIRERQKQGFEDSLAPLNMIFTGNPGTGKTTVAQMMADIYHSVGILENAGVMVQSGKNLSAGGIPPEQAVGMLINAAEGAILYIDEACALMQTPEGIAFIETLLTHLSADVYEGTIVILADYSEEMERMLQMNPGLKSYFPLQFDFVDYTPEELQHIAESKFSEKKYTLHPAAQKALKDLIGKLYAVKDKHFGNALLMDKLVDAAIRNISVRMMKIRTERELTRQELTTVLIADIPVEIVKVPKYTEGVFDEETINTAVADLEHMVGQQKIKEQIRGFVELARHYNKEGVKLNTKMSLQWCFTGNSGMGKGTVARIIARIYKAMGIIEGDIVSDFKAEKLIGQTEEEAQHLLGDALMKSAGGIFLFDEDSRKLLEAEGFRERVKAMLVNQIAEKPGAYTVIYVGPEPSIKKVNGDIEQISDMVNVLKFEDYTKDELMLILERKLEDEGMLLTQEAQQHMIQFIEILLSTDERSNSSSRLMKVVAELIVRNCIQRLAKKGEQITLSTTPISVIKSDVEMFTESTIASLVTERKKIGFV